MSTSTGGALGVLQGVGATVNVDIFTCIYFRGFMKMVNFACIKIRVFSVTGPL